MDFPNSGSQVPPFIPPQIPPPIPPPIPRSRDQWLMSSLFLMGGFLLIQLLSGNFYDLLNRFSYGDFDRFGSPDYYLDFRNLALIPLALLADFFLDRRDSLVIGAFMACFGLILMMLPFGLTLIPGMVFFGAGVALFELSLLAYFGSRWSGGLLRKDSGYVFLLAAGLFGSGLGWVANNWSVGSGSSLVMPIVLLLLMMGVGIASILLRKETFLAAEKIPGKWKSDRALGSVLIGVFVIISIIGVGIFSFLDPERETKGVFFSFLAMGFFALGTVILLTAKNYSIREKVSMLILIGLSVLFWSVIRNSSAIMAGGWDFIQSDDLDNSSIWVVTGMLTYAIPMLGITLLGGIWLFYPKKGKGSSASGIRLLAGLLIVTLVPFVVNGFSSTTGPAEGWFLIWTVLFSISFEMLKALFFSMIWKFSPVKFRTLGFALFSSGTYMVYQVRNTTDMITGGEPWYRGDHFDATTTILAVLMLFAAGALVFVRLRKWEN